MDFIDQHALVNTAVLLSAIGGSSRHQLMIDHQLRPLFSFFQALTLPESVFAVDADFEKYQLINEEVGERIELAASRALPFLLSRSQSFVELAS